MSPLEWLAVISDILCAFAFMTLGWLAKRRIVFALGATLFAAAGMMCWGVIMPIPEFKTWSYLLGWSSCAVGLWAMAGQQRR